jgi:PPOX class probable F420-dependent enzyme
VSSDFPKNPSRADVAAAPVARLATHNPSGAIDLVPITFALVGDDTIVTAVDHKPKRTTQLQRLENIRQNPNVTVLVDHYDDDWSALWWLRARGEAAVVDAPDAALLEPLVAKYAQYDEHHPRGPAIVIHLTDVAAWSGSPVPGDY